MRSRRTDSLLGLVPLLAGCTLWVGRANPAPYPFTPADLAEQASVPDTAETLDPRFAHPTLRSIAPDPVALSTNPHGWIESFTQEHQRVPGELEDGFWGRMGGPAGGVPVDVVIERLHALCLADNAGGLPAGGHVLVEASIAFGGGAYVRDRFSLYEPSCEGDGTLLTTAGARLASDVIRRSRDLVEVHPSASVARPAGPIEACLAADVRPRVERQGFNTPETATFFTLGAGIMQMRGSRLRGRGGASPDAESPAPSSAEAAAWTRAVAERLERAGVDIVVLDTPCAREEPAADGRATLWTRFENGYGQQYRRASEVATRTAGPVAITTDTVSLGATPPIGYARGAVRLCVGGVCVGDTLAASNRDTGRDEVSTKDWGAPHKALDPVFEESCRRLASVTARRVQSWLGGGASPLALPAAETPADE